MAIISQKVIKTVNFKKNKKNTCYLWDVDNDVVGAELDLYFYDNPIEVGQWAKIKIYTDNTANSCDWFRIGACPTAVPEPATLLLLGIGGLFLMRKRK